MVTSGCLKLKVKGVSNGAITRSIRQSINVVKEVRIPTNDARKETGALGEIQGQT